MNRDLEREGGGGGGGDWGGGGGAAAECGLSALQGPMSDGSSSIRPSGAQIVTRTTLPSCRMPN